MNTRTTDFEKFARAQLGRIGHLPGFPESPLAIRDYIGILCRMGTQEGIERLMDEIVAAEWERCPTAHQLGTIGHNLREARKQKKATCKICEGTGAVIIWNLVTYYGNSLKVQSQERLTDITSQEQAMNFARQIAENPGTNRQMVLSAAERCGCLA